jgi:NitT/TauT family transport system permease protein
MARAEQKPVQLVEVRPDQSPTSPLRVYLDNERAILGIASFVGFFLFWEIGAAVGWVDLFFFSSPSRILATAVREVQLPRFWNDVWVSGQELVGGYVAAVVIGIPLGIFCGWYRRINYFFDPWLNFMNALPRVALLPLIVLWVGLGIWSKIIVVFLGAFFSIVINTLYGVRTVDRRLLDVAHSFGANDPRIFRTVVLPGSVPFILAGLRLGVGRALIGVIVGELYAANAGLGYMITLASQTLQTDRLLFGVILLTLMGVLMVELLRVFEKRFQRWRPSVGSR